ncbi:hypothetical protein [Streptomyces yunnanensis]|uniref:hypothetical protein n=1 Tax=Streptomyces yunnanensis TaxID=156453 RepID=UPI000936D0FE|nr:hypothetical protein [Streptomyces yunnanensis]
MAVPVAGRVCIVSPHASLPVQCSTCGAQTGGSILLDGPQEFFLCPQGHASEDRNLEAARVRYAVRYSALPDDEEDLEEQDAMDEALYGQVEAALRLLGLGEGDKPRTSQVDLLVASGTQPVGIDPRRLFPFGRGRRE